jgi:DNA integrity scanning protein DisA with diadenylate cyclase activity
MNTLLDASLSLKEKKEVDVLFLITNEEDVVKEFTKEYSNTKIIVATNNRELAANLLETNIHVKRLSEKPLMGINILSQVEDIILGGSIEGLLKLEDRVECVLHMGNINSVLEFNVSDIGITHLKAELEATIKMEVLESIIQLCFEIAREGREGRALGALFVVGDSDNVLKYSRQIIINPFKGHSDEEKTLLNKENWETIKEFSQIDGAFIINDDGQAISAGRYVGISWDIYLQGGLGGRHLAAASISKITKAIAITVSTSGAIRIFKNGKMIFKVNAV